MSKEAKNEIDLMLRQLGRRGGALGPDVLFDSGEQHLDADELNSYVANALPTAARARYMEHIADCASCRRLVAQLSAAEGHVVVEQATRVPSPSALKQFLAGLLSPMVLRYAVPALGAIVITIVGFVVMREQARESATTFSLENKNGSVAQVASPTPSSLEGIVGQRATESAEPAAPKADPLKRESSGGATAEQRTADTANAAPVGASDAQPLAKSAEPAAPPAPKVAPTGAAETEGAKKAEVDAASRAKLAEAEAMRQRDEQKKAPEPQRQVAAAPATGANRPFETGRLASSEAIDNRAAKSRRDAAIDKSTAKDDASKEDAAKEKNEAAPETRSVAGRSFRKNGNVWVDTAYSSQQTTNMRRGSEQYRTLIGDVPEIRQIAEQLDGEFIVVWKGRAYRIR